MGSLVDMGPDQGVEGEVVAGGRPDTGGRVPVWGRTCWARLMPPRSH